MIRDQTFTPYTAVPNNFTPVNSKGKRRLLDQSNKVIKGYYNKMIDDCISQATLTLITCIT